MSDNPVRDWFSPRTAPAKRKYPAATVAGHAAPVDTTGMDPDPNDRTKILGIPRMRQPGDTTSAVQRGKPMGFWDSIMGLFHPKK